MKILYISHTHPPEKTILKNAGGMQRVSQQLIRELQSRDDVVVETETINVAGRGQVALKTTVFLVRLLLGLASTSRKVEADVILFSSMVTASLAYFLRKKIDIPMVAITHGRDVTLQQKIYQKFVPKIFASLDGVIAVSRATRAECVKRGLDPERGVALPNGFDFNSMRRLPDKKEAKTYLQRNFGISLHHKKMLLTVGRKVKRKGHEWFIREVLPKIKSDVVYVTIGDGPEFEKVNQLARESDHEIHLLGRQPDNLLKKAYAAADLFVMPNIPVDGDMEGFGVVLLEANVARTPAVASDLEGIKDVITAGENGYRVPTLDAEKFAATIDEVLTNGLAGFSEKTRDFVRKRFNWQQVAGQYIDFLAHTISRYNAEFTKK